MDRQYRAGGVTVALGLPSIAYTEGRCAGGGTEVNSGLYIRPPLDLIDRWRTDYRIEDLDPDEIVYDRRRGRDRRSTSARCRAARRRPARSSARGAAALGWRHSEIPRWMTYPPAATRSPASGRA